MNSNATEIERAIQTLGFASERFRRLPPDEAERVRQSAMQHFVQDGQPRCWWEHFPERTAVSFSGGDGWQQLSAIVPDADEKVWFIAEDHASPGYSVWEGGVRDIQAVIGECFGFEYYLIQQQHQWLICENHHHTLIAVGRQVEDKLRAMQAEDAEAGIAADLDGP